MRCIYGVELDMDGGGGEQEKDYPGVRIMEHGEGQHVALKEEQVSG